MCNLFLLLVKPDAVAVRLRSSWPSSQTPNTGPLEPTTVDVVPSAVVDPGYWSAVVDLSEHVHGLQEALDHDDDGHSSSLSSSDDEGDGPRQRAVAASMDRKLLETMTISNEFRSVPGLGEASLMVGQTFPDKDSADQAIKRDRKSVV